MPKELAPDRRILLAFLAIAGAVMAVLGFASLVSRGDTLAIDRRILFALRVPGHLGTPIGPGWLKTTMINITALGGLTLLTVITICAVGYLAAARRLATAGFLALSVTSGVMAGTLLKHAYLRARPDVVPHLVEVQTMSFPSAHAFNSAVTYLTIGAILAAGEQRRSVRIYLTSVAIALTLTIGVSRIYLGVHWPSDVLAGWCIGAIWSSACTFAARAVTAHRVRGTSRFA